VTRVVSLASVPPSYQHVYLACCDAYRAFLQRIGFNAVRVGVIWKAVEPTPGAAESVTGDIADLDAVRRAVAGVHTVIHLAADPNGRSGWESVLANNIIGTHNVFEAARLTTASPEEAWRSIQRFPAIWSRLSTGGPERTIVRAQPDSPDIALGNTIVGKAIVFGIPLEMRNVVTKVDPGRAFHLSVRVLGGGFESEVEAEVDPFDAGTLLSWRQAYPNARRLSRLAARVLRKREADETKEVLESWAAELAKMHATSGPR